MMVDPLARLKRRLELPKLALVLAVFAAAAYGPTLRLPFIGDDYVFLDKTRDASFAQLWSFKNLNFEWYRPWSRELHFWLLQRIVGLHEVAFRIFGLVLWIAALCLYAAIVRRLASTRAAAIATLGVAGLALWGTPLIWISGSQDLWMLCFAMASLALFIQGRMGWAVVSFGFALLSKETAAVLPILLCGYLVRLERRSLADALRRSASFWGLLVVWLALHPTLHTRLLGHSTRTEEVAHRPAPMVILGKTILSAANLDMIPHPREVGWGDLVLVLVSVLALGVGAVLALRGRPAPDSEEGTRSTAGALARFALVWMVAGWSPLFLPSIAWHAYYGCLGVLGAWLALAVWLQNRTRLAVAAIVCVALLRGAQANTLSWDWGNAGYQQRAGNILSAIRDDLYRQYPTLPGHSRVFFEHIPNSVGLIAGDSPALRVWYRDSTLQAGFYTYYRPRPASSAAGEDLFFRFDSAVGMVEVKAGPEDVRLGIGSDPDWEDDHLELAVLFLRSGDVSRAASEFEKVSELPRRADAAVYAAVCWAAAGDTARADSLIAAARIRTGLSESRMNAAVRRVQASFARR